MAARKSELIITCNAKGVENVMNFLTERLKGIKQQLQVLNNYGNQHGWTEDMKKDFKELSDEAAGIDTIMKRNQETMRKYGEVMRDLAGSKLKDVKKALQEGKVALNKMSENDPKRQRLIRDLEKIAQQMKIISGSAMSMKEATNNLKNLGSVSFDRLKQGLDAINQRLTSTKLKAKDRATLQGYAAQYQAEMAYRQSQTAVSTSPVSALNQQQLMAERSALSSAIGAMNGVKGYEKYLAQYEARLKEVNNQLSIFAEKTQAANQAQKQLQATQQAAQVVSQVYRKQAVSLEDLNAAYKTLEARAQRFAGVNPAKVEATRKQMAMLAREIQRVTNNMMGEIKIDKQFLKTATNTELQNALTQLQQRMQMLTSQNSKAAAKLKADMKAVQTQIERNTGAIQKQSATFGTAIKNIAAYVGVFGAFNMIKSKVMSVYQSNLKLSDSLADIRKVSGLTSQEIDKLYMNISKIDSRNTIETLNKLAYTGAKLGIGQNYGVEGLTGFVRAAEQVQMALGEDLGEDALPALAKLTEVMNLIPKYGVEQAMQKAASAIFQLGATSTATGRNIVEFSKRLMGLANVSRISADELLGIASASDALGIMPEVGATAFNKLFTSIQKNHNLIEKSLGLVQGSINENFSKGQTIKSIVDIFESMNKKGNMNALDGIFKDLGSDGARLVAVMTTMADRVDILKTHLATSTQAFKDGTAVINEYMIQNETANALMERASNLWAKAFTNPEGIDMVKQLAEEWYEVSKSMTQSEASMYAMHTSLEKITSIVTTLVQLLPFLIKMFTWMGIFGGIRMMVNSFLALGAAIRAATTATATLRVIMNSNWTLAGLAALAGGISLFIDSMNAAAEAAERAEKRQAQLDEQLLKSKEKINLVTAPLESYKKALDNSNKSLNERNRLLKDLLKSEYQQYLDYLGIEIDGALDLAEAYAKVVKVLKQKKAYEERESYRDEVNGENRINRMRAGMQFGQTAKSLGAGNVDAEWLRRRHNLPVESIVASVIGAAGGSTTSTDIGNIYRDKAGNLISKKVLDRLRKNIREYSTSRNAENIINKETDELYKDAVGDFDMDKFQEEVLKGQLKRKGTLENVKPDKDELKKQQKAMQEYKQALRKDLKDAKEDSDAIISKIEEWYRLQESVVSGMQADGKLTKDQADQVLRTLSVAKNTALRDARLAISGRDTTAWENTKMQIGNLMLDQGDWSAELLEQILQVSMDSIRTNLSKIDKGGGQFGITTTSLRDAIDKNAAGNQREIKRLNAQAQQEVEKILLENHYVETTIKGFSGRLAQMGILSESAESLANRLSDAEIGKYESSKGDMLQAFIKSGPQKFTVNPEDSASLSKWLSEFTGAQGGFNGFSKPFADDFKLWLSDSKLYKSEIQAFYLSLIDYEGKYYDALKKRDDLQQKRLDSWWEHSDEKKANDKQLRNLQLYEFGYNTMKNGETMGFMMGLTNDVNSDPEVLREKAILEAKIAIWQQAKKEREAGLISEEVYQQRVRDMQDQTMAYTQKVMDNINKRISRIQGFVKPVETAANSIGKKLGDMIFNMESEEATWEEIWKNMALAVAESMLTMAGQYAQNLIVKSAMNRAEEGEEGAHAAVMTMFGISEGAAKTIGTLGWVGIALIPVITALLMGLLTSALSTKRDSGNSASNTNVKTKLASGMLTYDEGNIGTYQGSDGQSYRAMAVSAPGDGLVTRPIATTVQGQPALVAERGPEIVIGRRTTKAIMMNEPGLIRYLANYGKSGNQMRRTFDEGNISTLQLPDAAEQPAGALSHDDALALTAAIGVFNKTVATMQQKGIPCYINKFGTGGLIDEVKSGLKFDSKYNGR